MSTPLTPDGAIEVLRGAIRPIGGGAPRRGSIDDDSNSTERVLLRESIGRVLAEPIRSDRPSPPVSVSAMDGYAIRLGDFAPDAARDSAPEAGHGARDPARRSQSYEVQVSDEVRVGCEPPALRPGSCIRITTGGAIPDGADTIIRREDVRERASSTGAPASRGRAADFITAPPAVASIEMSAEVLGRYQLGKHIRRAGENSAANTLILEPGRIIDAAAVGAMAAFGRERVQVRRRLVVSIVTTGDELQPPGAPIEPWQIRDSNGPVLEALLGSRAWIGAIHRAHVGDDLKATVAALERALAITLASESSAPRGADALVITGGVSMGHRDFVPQALERCGARTLFHKIPQRPGRPILGAIMPDGRPILALPGNPVSVLVTARRYLLPALALRAGIDEIDPSTLVQLANPDDTRLELWWYRLVRRAASGEVELVDARGSGDLIAAARSDGVIEIPPGASGPGPWPFRGWRS